MMDRRERKAQDRGSQVRVVEVFDVLSCLPKSTNWREWDDPDLHRTSAKANALL